MTTIYMVTMYFKHRIDRTTTLFVDKSDKVIIDNEVTARRCYNMFYGRLKSYESIPGYFGKAMLFKTTMNPETGWIRDKPENGNDIILEYTLLES
jgi:hypothetical protein